MISKKFGVEWRLLEPGRILISGTDTDKQFESINPSKLQSVRSPNFALEKSLIPPHPNPNFLVISLVRHQSPLFGLIPRFRYYYAIGFYRFQSCYGPRKRHERFDLRFVVIADRFPSSETVEELKDRYYRVSRVILTARGPSSGDAAGLPLVKVLEQAVPRHTTSRVAAHKKNAKHVG
ncbi:hypothetical protein OROMI_008988 [Orobanche minor]